ncbi:MAG: TlpA disulfide reductase family protein [Tissierellia bacterium]|nr:TlpA disulfide reductase family protein [Tissierellia bacterium]
MKKKFLIIFSILILILTACSKDVEKTDSILNKNEGLIENKEIGLKIKYNKELKDYIQSLDDVQFKQIMFDNYPTDMAKSMGFESYTNLILRTDEFLEKISENDLNNNNIGQYIKEHNEFLEFTKANQLEIFSIVTIDDNLNAIIDELKEKVKSIGAELVNLGNDNGLTYLALKTKREDVEEFLNKVNSEEIKTNLLDLYDHLEANIKIEQVERGKAGFLDIETVDLDGNKITGEIFKDKKLTILNAWGTFCGPCIKEMPDLQKLHEEIIKDNMQVVGIVMDVTEGDENQIAEAKRVIGDTNVEYLNLIPSKDMITNQLKDVFSIPTTYLIDSEGNILTSFVGAKSLEEFRELVEQYK